jgi:hypothetical protein
VFGRLIVELSFVPSPDVVVILNALLDKLENRAKRDHLVSESEGTYRAAHSIKISLTDLPLPSYFSQTDPEPRIIANQQLQTLEQQGLLQLQWLPGESGHLLQTVTLETESATRSTQPAALYQLLKRTPISDHRARLESLLLAEKFRYRRDDWRAHALNYILGQLWVGKSPSPFSLSDSNLNIDLLAILQSLPTLTTETPYRVFSVRLFNEPNASTISKLLSSDLRAAPTMNGNCSAAKTYYANSTWWLTPLTFIFPEAGNSPIATVTSFTLALSYLL